MGTAEQVEREVAVTADVDPQLVTVALLGDLQLLQRRLVRGAGPAGEAQRLVAVAADEQKVATASPNQLGFVQSGRWLLCLDPLPQRLLPGQVKLAEAAAVGCSELLHLAKASLELGIGVAQSAREVDAGVMGQVHRDEQHVADLVFEPRRVGTTVKLGTHFADLFEQFVQHRCGPGQVNPAPAARLGENAGMSGHAEQRRRNYSRTALRSRPAQSIEQSPTAINSGFSSDSPRL